MTTAAVTAAILAGKPLTTLGGSLTYAYQDYKVWVFPDDEFALLTVWNARHRHYRVKGWYSSPYDCLVAAGAFASYEHAAATLEA